MRRLHATAIVVIAWKQQAPQFRSAEATLLIFRASRYLGIPWQRQQRPPCLGCGWHLSAAGGCSASGYKLTTANGRHEQIIVTTRRQSHDGFWG